MEKGYDTERNIVLLESRTYIPSQWTKKAGVKMRRKKDLINNKTKRFARVGVCVGCSLFCFVCGLELELSKATTEQIIEENKKLLSSWSPGYWQTMGSLLGCLISGISLCYVGRRTSLQRVAAPLLAIACCLTFSSTKIKSESSMFLIMITFQVFMQNICRSLSIIIPSIYILETICWHPGSHKSKAGAVLLALTQIPPAISHLLITMKIIELDTYRALIIPLAIILATMIILNLAPESPRWLLQIKQRVNEAALSLKSLWSEKSVEFDIDRELTCMEREMQVISTLCEPNSYIKPLITLSCFLLLVQLMGYGAYKFYTSWAYNFSGLTMIDSDIVTSFIQLIAIYISTVISFLRPGPKYINIILVVTTCLLMLSLIITGIFMYALEQGSIGTDQLVGLPIVLLIIYQVSFWLGIGSYAIPSCTLIMPPKSRPIILTICITVYQMSSYFCDVFLPLMISVLHPYGVFWFHGCLTGVGLVYISLVIVPELKWTEKCFKNNERAETVF